MRLGDFDALKEHAQKLLVGESINTYFGINLYKMFEEIIDNTPTVEGEILTKEAYSDLCLRASRARPQGKCKSCRHRDPEDKKCDCGGQERQGCIFPVSDNYYCKYYEKGDAE